MRKGKTLNLFDFDGTITHRDSLLHFFACTKNKFQLISGYLYILPFVVLMKLKLYPNEKAKSRFFAFHFKGMAIDEFNSLCAHYGENELPKIIRPSFLEYLSSLKKDSMDHTFVLVSASFESYLKYWASGMQFDLIATKIEVKDGVVTGRFSTHNCYGPEKVTRINEVYELSAYSEINVYGDSRGDREMLELGTSGYFKYFK